MVKKKYKSKRTTLKDKYKIQRRVAETHRKRKKQAKRDAANGVVRHDNKKKKDPGIPNSWPFKQDLLKEIQRTRERQRQLQDEARGRREMELAALREHQERGGTARTVQELAERAGRDQADFDLRRDDGDDGDGDDDDGGRAEDGGFGGETRTRSDGAVAAGQQSRRAYLREMKKVIDTADVLLQVLDARDPAGSRVHPSVENAVLSHADKRMVLVLNKIDLVPKDVVSSWLTALRRGHPTIAVRASGVDRAEASGDGDDGASSSGLATSSAGAVGMDGLLQLLKNYARTGGAGGKSKTTIVVGVIGYPNVGKSSIINALKRCRAVGVSPRPGFTTSTQEVVLDRNVRLLDSPGIVFDDRSTMLGNCVDASSVDDPVPAVAALLKRCDHASLLMTYNIPSFPSGDVMMFLSMVARTYGRVLKGGIPDKVSAARTVLRDWNQGKIPYFTSPPEDSGPEVAGDAVVVSHFGAEFDVAKFDREVMGSLKDSDEMDFVKLQDAGADRGDAAEDVDYLTGRDAAGDENSDMDEDDQQRQIPSRRDLAKAEDYDFDDL